jgi:type II secretory ATPase GspE/PulE/Tfp pilus assembly ATPase PilB-like protein
MMNQNRSLAERVSMVEERPVEDARADLFSSVNDDTPLLSLLLEDGAITEESASAYATDANHSSIGLSEYLITRKILPRRDIYHYLFRLKRPLLIDRPEDLPEWDLVLNDVEQPLFDGSAPDRVVLLGLASEKSLGHRHVFTLCTEEELRSFNFAEVAANLVANNFTLRGHLIAKDATILQVVKAQWQTQKFGNAGHAKATESELHQIWNHIIQSASDLGASDIHLKGTLGLGSIHFRIHGELEPFPYTLTEQQAIDLASSLFNTLVDDGSTTDGFIPTIPQDAVISWALPQGNIRLRYSGLPIEPTGIDVTLRLIPIGIVVKPKPLQEFGYSNDQAEDMERIFYRSSGLILFVGTTGSGKTTSMANELSRLTLTRPGKKLRTVEEPVEIRILGASQTSVARKSKDGTEFNDVLRGIMRSDPDFLGIGEIRDRVTASLALQAVRSGHLAVSSLHAESGPMSYDRLEGLGVDRRDLAKVGLVVALIYQRLVPVLCTHCRQKVGPLEQVPEYSGMVSRLRRYMQEHHPDRADPFEGVFVRNPLGCKHCKQRGITGRTVCAEIFIPRVGMLPLIASGNSPDLWHEWRKEIDPTKPERMRGRTAFEHALWKMMQGIVSPVDVEKEFRFLDEPVFG